MSNRDLGPPAIGQLKVTVEYKITIHNLEEYGAKSLEDAARIQAAWYEEGIDYPSEALSYTVADSIKVEVVPEEAERT